MQGYAAMPVVHEGALDEMMLTEVVGDKEAGDGSRSHNGTTPKNSNSLVS
jgi:hypothetical protein